MSQMREVDEVDEEVQHAETSEKREMCSSFIDFKLSLVESPLRRLCFPVF